jgi:hypothetical protein
MMRNERHFSEMCVSLNKDLSFITSTELLPIVEFIYHEFMLSHLSSGNEVGQRQLSMKHLYTNMHENTQHCIYIN